MDDHHARALISHRADLLKEENEIIVFAEQPTETPVISIRDYHVLAETKTEEGPVTIM